MNTLKWMLDITANLCWFAVAYILLVQPSYLRKYVRQCVDAAVTFYLKKAGVSTSGSWLEEDNG